MLKKFDLEEFSLDDFKVKLVSYRACLEGWQEWIDNVFMASFGLWTHKDQVSHTCQVIYDLIGCAVVVTCQWLDFCIK
jgi:hypothetical protein